MVAVGGAIVAYDLSRAWSLVTDFQAASGTKFMDPNTLYSCLVLPILACAGGGIAILEGFVALPPPSPSVNPRDTDPFRTVLALGIQAPTGGYL